MGFRRFAIAPAVIAVIGVAAVVACGGSDDDGGSSSGSTVDGGAGGDDGSIHPGPDPFDPAKCTAPPATGTEIVPETVPGTVCSLVTEGKDVFFTYLLGNSEAYRRAPVTGASGSSKVSVPTETVDGYCEPAVTDGTEVFTPFTGGIFAYDIAGDSWRKVGAGAMPIATDGDRLYAIYPSSVGWLPKAGGDFVEIALRNDLAPNRSLFAPFAAIDASHIYFADIHEGPPDGTTSKEVWGISRAPKDGGSKEKLTLTPAQSKQIAIVGDVLFFVGGGDYTDAPFRRLERAPKTGGASTVIDPGPVSALVSDGARLYWSTASGAAGPGIYVLDPACGDAPRLFTAEVDEVDRLTFDATHLYWNVRTELDGAPDSNKLWRAPR